MLSTTLEPYIDNDGSTVKIKLSGNGTVVLTQDENGRSLTLTGTDQGSSLSVSVSGGTDKITTLHNINVALAIKSIAAKNVNITGNVTIGGAVSTVTLRDVDGDGQSLLSIGGSSSARSASVTMANVTDLTINSGAPIKTLSVSNWIDTNDNDVVTAPFASSIKSKLDFAAGLRLDGDNAPAYTLSTVSVKGALSGVWSVDGDAKSVSAGSITDTFSANFTQLLGKLSVSHDVSGTIAANAFKTVSIKGNMVSAKLLAGADLGLDAKLGGTGLDTDLFSRGTFTSVYVRGQLIGSTIGAGLDPSDGVFNNENDFVTGKLRSFVKKIKIKGTADADSSLAAGLFPKKVSVGGTSVDPFGDPRFLIGDTGSDDNAPVIQAGLEVITGNVSGVDVTNAPSIAGRVTDLGRVVLFSLRIRTSNGLDPDTISPAKSFLKSIEPNGTFTISRSELEQTNERVPFVSGKTYAALLDARDEDGNNTVTLQIQFKFVA